MKKIVVIPTYNEKENIEKIIRKVFSLQDDFHVLVVDDNSPDGTADIVNHLIPSFTDSLFLIKREGKQGLGTAYIAGFKWSLEKGYDYIFEMDADFSHNPEDLPRLYQACLEGADVSIGSRYIKGGKVVNWPFDRIFISYGASLYVRLVLWLPVKDCTAGFVCYKAEVLRKINLDKIRFVGYAFQIEMKFKAWRNKFRLKEIPIVFEDRKEGVSKMSKGIVQEAIMGVWKMRLSFIFGK